MAADLIGRPITSSPLWHLACIRPWQPEPDEPLHTFAMTAPLRQLGQLLDRGSALLIRADFEVRQRWGEPARVHLVGFDGYGTPEWLRIHGRVMEDRRGEDSPTRALARLWRNQIGRSQVRARLGSETVDVQTDPRGFFTCEFHAPAGARAPWTRVELEITGLPVPADVDALGEARVRIPAPTAERMILSDIDDTVVQSHTGNRLDMARKTLLRSAAEREPVPGMPALYRALQGGRDGQAANPVFYHSTQSWNAYEHLSATLEAHGLPRGPLFLRRYGAESALTRNDRDHKIQTLRTLLNAYPELPVLLIGDTSREDPLAYLHVARQYPGRVRAIYLRRAGSAASVERAKMLALEMRVQGAEVVLTGSVRAMADHAAERGWITAEAHAEVRGESEDLAAAPKNGGARGSG